ncbi:MAG: glutathione S-transferase C-terminal domain-containing protein [Stellaceae bacterium]
MPVSIFTRPRCAPEIDEINRFIYDNINNGVYRAGLAKSQEAYEQAFRNLFVAFDELEARLSRQRWLVGGQFTEADLRLFPTLIRFDAVYYVLFKCNLRRLADYHHLSNYTREIYQMPGVAATVDFEKIKLGYYGGMRHLNPRGILPLGPALDFAEPHDRSQLNGDPFHGVARIGQPTHRPRRQRRLPELIGLH